MSGAGGERGSAISLLALLLAVAQLAPAQLAPGAAEGRDAASARPEEGSSLAAARDLWASLGWKGKAVFKSFSHFEETANEDRNFREEGLLELEWARRISPWLSTKILLDVQGDDEKLARDVAFRVPETGRRRSHLDLEEAFVRIRSRDVELTLGKQIYAWGTADAFNPTDKLNPRDYLDPLDHEKMGVYSASSRWSRGTSSLALAAVPVFTPSRLPLPESRWLPPPPAGFAAVVDPQDLPSVEADNVQYAARLKTTTRGWDLSASYYRGFESTPAFRGSSAVLPDGRVIPRLTPVFGEIQLAGLDFSTTYEALELHGEGAAGFAERNAANDRFQWIVGLNYTWDDAFDIAFLEQILVIVEYARENAIHRHRGAAIVDSESAPGVGNLLETDAFRSAVAGRLQWKASEETRFEASGIGDLDGPASAYVQPRLVRKLSEAVEVEFGLDLLVGSRKSFWGRWAANDRFFLFFTWFF